MLLTGILFLAYAGYLGLQLLGVSPFVSALIVGAVCVILAIVPRDRLLR